MRGLVLVGCIAAVACLVINIKYQNHRLVSYHHKHIRTHSETNNNKQKKLHADTAAKIAVLKLLIHTRPRAYYCFKFIKLFLRGIDFNRRVIKMSSPKMNTCTIFGCIVCYASIVMDGLDATAVSPKLLVNLSYVSK